MQSCSCTWKPNIRFPCWYHQSNPYSPCFYCSSMWRSGRTSASWYKNPGVDVTGKKTFSIYFLLCTNVNSPDWWCKGFRFSTHSGVLKCQKSNSKDTLEQQRFSNLCMKVLNFTFVCLHTLLFKPISLQSSKLPLKTVLVTYPGR